MLSIFHVNVLFVHSITLSDTFAKYLQTQYVLCVHLNTLLDTFGKYLPSRIEYTFNTFAKYLPSQYLLFVQTCWCTHIEDQNMQVKNQVK